MKQPLKPGDRVAVYYENGREIRTIKSDMGNGIFWADINGYSGVRVHEKQCRRLKKRERMEIEIWRDSAGGLHTDADAVFRQISLRPGEKKIFREVRNAK